MSHLSFFSLATWHLVDAQNIFVQYVVCWMDIQCQLNGWTVRKNGCMNWWLYLHATLCKIFDTSPCVFRKRKPDSFGGLMYFIFGFYSLVSEAWGYNKCQLPLLDLTVRQFVITNLKGSSILFIFSVFIYLTCCLDI